MNPYKAAKYVLNRTNDKINKSLALLEKDYGIKPKMKYKLFIWECGQQCMQIRKRSPEDIKRHYVQVIVMVSHLVQACRTLNSNSVKNK